MKYIPKRLIDFLWINVYEMNWKLWYDRIYESKTMDCLENIYKWIVYIYSLFLTLVHKIAFGISFMMFALIPSAWGLSPLKRSEILTSWIVRKRESLKEEYQAQFQEIVENAIDGNIVNAELLAMDDEDRIAYFVKNNQDITMMYELQDKEIDDWMMKRCYIEYPTFKIFLRRTWLHSNYKVVSFVSTTTDWFTNHIVTLGKSNKESDYEILFDAIANKLIPEEKEIVNAIDDKLVLPIPKLKFVLEDYIAYQWIPDRTKPKVRDIEAEYAPLINMMNAFWSIQEEQKVQDNVKLEELKKLLEWFIVKK